MERIKFVELIAISNYYNCSYAKRQADANEYTDKVVTELQTETVIKNPEIFQLISDMHDLKLFLLQGQGNTGSKSPMMENRRNPIQNVRFVTCHGCRLKIHYKSDCPNQDKVAATPIVKLIEINLLQAASDNSILEGEV